jgi:5-(carboxyamino)imidazole ribonucleotide mutase
MNSKPEIGIIMGSDSDLSIMKEAAEILDQFGIAYEVRIVSAHRTPDHMVEYAKTAVFRGLKIIIAGAGGAAHLPGMIASLTVLPVIGVPVKSKNSMDGWDSILSILQMPKGVPVATVALNGGKNAGLLACKILALQNENIRTQLLDYTYRQKTEVLEKDKSVAQRYFSHKEDDNQKLPDA